MRFKFFRRLRVWTVGLAIIGAGPLRAEDIDIFMANTVGGSTVQPNIMIMLDNSSNWGRSSQKWPDNITSDGGGKSSGKQGIAELQSIINILSQPTVNANIGFAGYTGGGSSIGGYIRFGVRDMRVAANKTALTGILSLIKTDITSSTEKVNDADESAAMYEIYKYFKGMSVFRGGKVTNDPSVNVDISGNNGSPDDQKRTGHQWDLTTGFAYTGTAYNSPSASGCGRNYLIFVANNAQGSVPSGSQTYEGTSAGTALSAISGVNDVSWTDEWARFLYQSGISVYILDAYNAQQNVSHSKVLQRAALVGGGKYFAVKSQEQIELAIKQIMAEINAVNSTFATASLPISATNRSQNLNQVFIGMFRPDGQAEPRWVGNLKQYQLLKTSSGVELGDALGVNAINLQTGFISECSASFWTTDSGSYWQTVYDNVYAMSSCTAFPTVAGTVGSQWSDAPDGPTVEKGGAAEVIRKGNNPSVTNTAPTWGVSNRTLLTYSGTDATKLQPLTASVPGWSTTLYTWVTGLDDDTPVTKDGVTSRPYSEFTNTSSTPRTRPSIHGDVIHSRPLPVNYGGTTGVTVFYGANDGLLRAVSAADGKERWAYVGPEHYSKFQRLHDNTPLVNYPNVSASLSPRAKDYFFDGSIGIYQTADNSRVWIFPSQRRGGRMLYAFDVTNPASPTLKWRVGCPNLADDVGCSEGFAGIGQTWSMPSVAFLKGHSEEYPVVIVGGGYDSCEDSNSGAPTCTSRKGTGLYIIHAHTGALLKLLPTTGSVPADVALADGNNDGSVDYAYVTTTTGEIYRADFSNTALVAQDKDSWAIRKVAHTTGGNRKFLYPPALLNTGTKMYVALGSGDREHPLSTHYPVTAPVQNRFYVYMDDLSVAASATATAVDLDNDAAMLNYSTASGSTCDTTKVTPSSSYKGWYMNLPGTGEQTVTSALIAAGMVTFNTNRAMTSSADACTNPLGEARGYWVNLQNASGAIGVGTAKTCGGDRSSAFIGGGLTPSPTMATVTIDGRVTTVAIGAAQRSGGASSGIAPQQVGPAINSQRRAVYWKSNTAD